MDKISCGWQPDFIAFSDNGDMFVTSGSTNKIYVYDKSNLHKSSFGSKGTGDLQFQDLNGIAISGEGQILVVTEYRRSPLEGSFWGRLGRKVQM